MALFGVLTGVALGFGEGGGLPWGATGSWNPGCEACHSYQSVDFALIMDDAAGPHGGFTATTDDCKNCHDVHQARSSNKLLPSATVLGVCVTCHDFSFSGTGGFTSGGVYGAIRAQGEIVRARHNIEGYDNTETSPPGGARSYAATSNIPGGNTDLTANLDCLSCHTPHGNTVVRPFPAQRYRMGAFSTTDTTNRILQDDLNGTPKGTYTTYGAAWCAGCHDRRHSGASGVNNHPTDVTDAQYFDASMSAQGRYWTEDAVPDATLGTRQAGWSREASAGWAPMCQQCHDNYRDVESPYQVSDTNDGRIPSDNPRFQTFPHESTGANFEVETGDDLCMNCHTTGGLP